MKDYYSGPNVTKQCRNVSYWAKMLTKQLIYLSPGTTFISTNQSVHLESHPGQKFNEVHETTAGMNMNRSYKYFLTNLHDSHQVSPMLYIIIIMLAQISLTLSIYTYHPSLLACFPNYILCPYRVDVDRVLLIIQHWHVHVFGVHRWMSLILAHLTWMVLETGG